MQPLTKMKENSGREQQLTSVLLMIAPSMFGLNKQTMDNKFQHTFQDLTEQQITQRAIQEFDSMVEVLTQAGIEVVVTPTRTDATEKMPDAVFPNNWISFHPDRIILYPMLAINRREERQLENVKQEITRQTGKQIHAKVEDLSYLEKSGLYLEGTGSLILDRVAHVGFAAISQRTHLEALDIFSAKTGYKIITFHSHDANGHAIYHTNVVMSVGEKFAVVCFDAISDETEKAIIRQQLTALGKDIFSISMEQMTNFCGNILQVKNTAGLPKIIMSQTAYDAFTTEQKLGLEHHGALLPVKIPTIEKVGGGSARCMLAEVFESVTNV